MKCPDHVLMTADAVGGVWTYVLELARALAKCGVRATVVTMGPRPSAPQRAEAAAVPHLELIETDFQLEWADNPWDAVDRAGEWLLQLEATLRPDIVHLNGYCHGCLDWRAPAVVVAHSCVVSWWHAVHRQEPPAAWNTYRDRVRAGLAGADAVVAVSQAMAGELAGHYGVYGSAVIHNGRNPDGFHSRAKEPVILTSGRAWDEAKNIAALRGIADRLSWPVILAGDTSHPHRGQIDSGRLRAMGRLNTDEMKDQYARAAIYALPALYEPFGLSPLEAALSGCALVLGDIPSLREIWADAALFVDGRDPEALAECLNSLAADPALHQDMSRRARERAVIYTPQRMASRYLDIYDRAGLRRRTGQEAPASCA